MQSVTKRNEKCHFPTAPSFHSFGFVTTHTTCRVCFLFTRYDVFPPNLFYANQHVTFWWLLLKSWVWGCFVFCPKLPLFFFEQKTHCGIKYLTKTYWTLPIGEYTLVYISLVIVFPLFFFFRLHIQFILNFVLFCFSYDDVTYKSMVTLDAAAVTARAWWFLCNRQVFLLLCVLTNSPLWLCVLPSILFCAVLLLLPRSTPAKADVPTLLLDLSLIFHSPFPWTLADKELLSSKCSQCFS